MSALTKQLFELIDRAPVLSRNRIDDLHSNCDNAGEYFRTRSFEQRHVVMAVMLYGNETLRGMLTEEERVFCRNTANKLILGVRAMQSPVLPFSKVTNRLRERGVM